MGNYLCYLCNQDFIFLSGLRKHYEKDKCPRVTPEMKALQLEPFIRVLIQVYSVNPKKGKHAEKFEYSHNIQTNNLQGKSITDKLVEIAREIGLNITAVQNEVGKV